MKKIFAAVQTPTFNYVKTLTPNTNILNLFPHATFVSVFPTKKEAYEAVSRWDWDDIKKKNLYVER